ncbi:MAG TPA: hypothetical protein VGG74_00265 [Kofleriaceae bacterium]|jgi:hypothetical protein
MSAAATAEIRELIGKADGAAREGDGASARAAFVDAAVCASSNGMWRAAIRCYRRALELDVCDRELVGRIATIAGKANADWLDYARALDNNPTWPPFGCRNAQIVVGDLGGMITCPGAGVVLEVMMGEGDHVDVHPDGRFGGMPLAMAMLIVRRALWPAPRELSLEPRSIAVTFAAGPRVRLDELGDWQALA